MKKTTAVILGIILIFSIFTCVAFAESASQPIPTPDDITYVEPTFPPKPAPDLDNIIKSLFDPPISGENGFVATFISILRDFFENAIIFVQSIFQGI